MVISSQDLCRFEGFVLRAVGYIRVSTREQDEEVQVGAIEEFAKNRGFELVGVYVDKGESGAKPFAERPEAQRLLSELDAIKPDAIIAWSLDRFGRTMLDTLNMVLSLEGRGYKVITVKEDWLQTMDDNVRKLVLSILSWVAEFERKRIKERQEEAWRQGKQKGRPKKVSDNILLEYIKKYAKYGSKKYAWLRLKEDGYNISYDRFLRRLKDLTRK
ncbi:MAG: recombinase family protein [Candidatus Bathyarchaeia archaeon]